jgi:hypothetical protein
VIGGLPTKFSDSEYNNETELSFIMDSLERLRGGDSRKAPIAGRPLMICRKDSYHILTAIIRTLHYAALALAQSYVPQPPVNLGDISFLDHAAAVAKRKLSS